MCFSLSLFLSLFYCHWSDCWCVTKGRLPVLCVCVCGLWVWFNYCKDFGFHHLSVFCVIFCVGIQINKLLIMFFFFFFFFTKGLCWWGVLVVSLNCFFHNPQSQHMGKTNISFFKKATGTLDLHFPWRRKFDEPRIPRGGSMLPPVGKCCHLFFEFVTIWTGNFFAFQGYP